MALSLGVSPSQLRNSWTTKDFLEVETYLSVEPWGEERQDLRIALLTLSVVQTVMSCFGGNAGSLNLSDFHLGRVLGVMDQEERERKIAEKNRIAASLIFGIPMKE